MDRRATHSMERIERELADHVAESMAITVDLRDDADLDSEDPGVDIVTA